MNLERAGKTVERLLLCFWVGGLWLTGLVTVPSLFRQLADDHHLAGQLAATQFRMLGWIGLGCGFALLLLNRWRHGSFGNWRAVVLAVMLVLVAVGLFVVQPQILALRDAAGLTGEALARFRVLHGVGSVLFLGTAVLGAVLVAADNEKRGPSSE